MNKTIIAAAMGFGLWLLAVAALPPAAHAQCDPASEPCQPPDKDQEKRLKRTPTDTPRPPTETPTLVFVPRSGGGGGTLLPIESFTPTIEPYMLTADMCDEDVALTPPAARTPPGSGPPFTQCHPTRTPTPAPPIVLPPTAGPVFLKPGVKNALILVMIVGVLFTGGVFVRRAIKQK